MLRVFYSYSHKDAESCYRLAAHLKGLSELLETWDDRAIRLGDPWNRAISDHLDQADLVIVLMSADYMASNFCELELERAMERYEKGTVKILVVMLTDYNLAGSGLGKLQTFPPVDRPISAWPDKDAAFAALSREVEKVAREMTGSAPRNKLMHPNRGELSKLLFRICDRTPQRDNLVQTMRPKAFNPKRPFVIVMHGTRQDAHDWFLDRLEHRLLPELIGSKPGRLTPLEWPEFSAKKTPIEMFGPRLAGSLSVSPWATESEFNAALKQHSSANLLPCTVAATEWGKTGAKLFDAFLQLWEKWPDLPEEHLFFPVVAVKYDHEETNPKIASYLNRLRFAARPGLSGTVLPQFDPIRQTHMENWINHPQVSSFFDSPETAIGRLNVIFDRQPAIPIQPLGEVHFPRFLETL